MLRNFAKTIVYISIGVAQNNVSMIQEILVTSVISLLVKFLIMLASVQFDYDFGRSNVKVHNVWSDWFLTMDGDRKLFQTVIPQMSLFLCHILAKLLCIWN